jgi:hypothetical protein
MHAKYYKGEKVETSEMENTGDNGKTYNFLMGKPE